MSIPEPQLGEINLADPAEHWIQVRRLVAPQEQQQLARVYHVAQQVHAGQWRKTAEHAVQVPYIVHPLRVARIVAEEWRRGDLRTLATCLLHDVLEDCLPTEQEAHEQKIREVAGDEVLDVVSILTRPAPAPAEARSARDARYFSQLFHAPEWVRLVKCADRVDNLRDARAWGNMEFWNRYSSETIGWHLNLARITMPIAEVALFKELVDGERALRGSVPIWADGHLIDRSAAVLVPEHISRHYGAVGLALQGDTLFVGLRSPKDPQAVQAIRLALRAAHGLHIEPVEISADAIRDAQAAGLFGGVGMA